MIEIITIVSTTEGVSFEINIDVRVCWFASGSEERLNLFGQTINGKSRTVSRSTLPFTMRRSLSNQSHRLAL